MQFITLIASLVLGFAVFELLSNPKKTPYQKLPCIQIKRIQLMPNIKIHFGGRIVHLHHWISLSLILVITVIYNTGFLETVFARGALIGGIAQGLTYPDWKKIIHK